MCICRFICDPTSWKHLSFWNCLAVSAKVTRALCRPLKTSMELLSWTESPNGCVALLRELFVFSCFPAPLFQGWFYGWCKSAQYYWLQTDMPVCSGGSALSCEFGHHAMRTSLGIWTDKCFCWIVRPVSSAHCCCALHEVRGTPAVKRLWEWTSLLTVFWNTMAQDTSLRHPDACCNRQQWAQHRAFPRLQAALSRRRVAVATRVRSLAGSGQQALEAGLCGAAVKTRAINSCLVNNASLKAYTF